MIDRGKAPGPQRIIVLGGIVAQRVLSVHGPEGPNSTSWSPAAALAALVPIAKWLNPSAWALVRRVNGIQPNSA